jgi:hypothetical protein
MAKRASKAEMQARRWYQAAMRATRFADKLNRECVTCGTPSGRWDGEDWIVDDEDGEPLAVCLARTARSQRFETAAA